MSCIKRKYIRIYLTHIYKDYIFIHNLIMFIKIMYLHKDLLYICTKRCPYLLPGPKEREEKREGVTDRQRERRAAERHVCAA
jgi:hypothetical protein